MTALAQPDRAPVECIVKIDGEEISELYRYLTIVEVRMSRKAAATCTLKLDTFRDEQGEWLVPDQNKIEPWQTVLIEAQFGDRSEEVMRGFVRDVQIEHPKDMSSSSVTVRCQDDSLLLDREHIRHVWSTEDEQMSDGQIAEQIGLDNGLGADTDPGLENAAMNQDGTSIDFLKKRAEANGFELFFRDGKLHFFAPRLTEEPQATIMVYAGLTTNCLSFQVAHDGHKPDLVNVVRGADTGTEPETMELQPDLALLGSIAANSENMGLQPFKWSMNQPRGATRAEADSRAQAAVNKNAWKIVANGELDGALYGHVLLTHRTVEVDGVGSTYGGKYYVDEVTHKFSMDGYRETFKLLRNAIGQQL